MASMCQLCRYRRPGATVWKHLWMKLERSRLRSARRSRGSSVTCHARPRHRPRHHGARAILSTGPGTPRVADAIKDCSRRRGIVLDGFAGSGSTIIAAQKTGRRAYAMELDPKYVQTAIRRWQDFTGEAAIHAETGLTFHEFCEARVEDRRAPRDVPEVDATSQLTAPKESRHVE